jgi:hypothetical protein
MAAAQRVQFKFRTTAPVQKRDALIKQLVQPLATDIRPLFPTAIDPELATVYRAVTLSPEAARELIKRLARHPSIEFAEPEAARTLKPALSGSGRHKI